MPKAIKDEFANLKISRQRKYQLRMAKAEKCMICGEPAVHSSKCLTHLVKTRERVRKKLGAKRRLYSTLTYRLQEEAKRDNSGRSKLE